MDFRERLKKLISDKGYSLKDFAAAVPMSYSTLLSLVDAREMLPRIDLAWKLARTLDVPLNYLILGETEEERKGEVSAEKEREKKLLEAFRNLSEENKNLIMQLVSALPVA